MLFLKKNNQWDVFNSMHLLHAFITCIYAPATDQNLAFNNHYQQYD